MARVEVLFTNVAVNSVHLEEMHSVFGGRLGPPLSLDYRVNSCQSEFTLIYTEMQVPAHSLFPLSKTMHQSLLWCHVCPSVDHQTSEEPTQQIC